MLGKEKIQIKYCGREVDATYMFFSNFGPSYFLKHIFQKLRDGWLISVRDIKDKISAMQVVTILWDRTNFLTLDRVIVRDHSPSEYYLLTYKHHQVFLDWSYLVDLFILVFFLRSFFLKENCRFLDKDSLIVLNKTKR